MNSWGPLGRHMCRASQCLALSICPVTASREVKMTTRRRKREEEEDTACALREPTAWCGLSDWMYTDNRICSICSQLDAHLCSSEESPEGRQSGPPEQLRSASAGSQEDARAAVTQGFSSWCHRYFPALHKAKEVEKTLPSAQTFPELTTFLWQQRLLLPKTNPKNEPTAPWENFFLNVVLL